MEHEKIFKIKKGFCHILPGKIVLSKNGFIGDVAKGSDANDIAKKLIIYGGMSLVLFILGFEFYSKGHLLLSFLVGIPGLYFIYKSLSGLNVTVTPIIERNKIREVKFKKAFFGLTRSCFEVTFEDKHGKIIKRLIVLPGLLTYKQNETLRAIEIMTEEKLITNG